MTVDDFDAHSDELEVIRAAMVERVVDMRPPLGAGDFSEPALGALYAAALKAPRTPWSKLMEHVPEKHREGVGRLSQAVYDARAATTSGPARRVRERALVRQMGNPKLDAGELIELCHAAAEMRSAP